MARQNKKFRLFRRHPKTTGALVLIAGVAAGFLAFSGGDATPTATDSGSGTKPATSKPSDNKPQTVEQPNNPKNEPASNPAPSQTSGKKHVSPTITSAGREGSNIVVRAYVSGIFEDGGTCTATFIKNSQKLTGNSKGFENVSYTTCGPIKINRQKFLTAGDWALTVTYSSAAAEGSSSQTVKVD